MFCILLVAATVQQTYDIRREVSEAREDQIRREAADDGHGPLFD